MIKSLCTQKTNIFINLIITCSLLLIIMSTIVPFTPKMPNSSLDSSWALGLNQAVSEGFSFGKQIMFTLGPYSSIYTKAYHPATDCMMMWGSLYFALSYWLCLILLTKNTPKFWVLAFGILLFGMIYSRDSLLFSYPLLIGLFSLKNIDSQNSNKKTHLFLLTFLLSPIGLLPLIKGSALILCIVFTFLCSLFFLLNKEKIRAALALLTPIFSMMLFWAFAGQSLKYLPNYFTSTLTLSSGFTEAMANSGDTSEILIYLTTSFLLLLLLSLQKKWIGIKKIFLFCVFFIFLFLSFKAGFTRHYGHAYIAGTSILIAGLFLPFILDASKPVLLVVICSLLTWYYIIHHYTNISLQRNFMSTYSATWHGFKNRIHDKNLLQQDFNLSMDVLKAQADFPIFKGNSDIYPYDLSYLIASKNKWLPRPVFQSYSVFSSSLAQANNKHLQNSQNPDTIFFKIAPIDERLPSLEDGISWLTLLTTYTPLQIKNDFLYLHKRNLIDQTIKPVQLLGIENHTLGEEVSLSKKQFSYVELDIKPTIWGHLAIILFKPAPLEITLNLKNGTQKHFRLIASMAKSGFLLSPLIENSTEFSLLYTNPRALDDKNILSFVINTSPPASWQWHLDYQIGFKNRVLAGTT